MGRIAGGMMGMALVLATGLAWAGSPPLRVMLTNDDGYEAAGLKAVRAALERAGCAVTVVAPLAQQSGSGVRITLGEIAVADHGHATWSVDGSPADSASYGLTQVLAGARPDVVVSGANLGQNLGANVVSSGTVGAAVMASQLGVPAIAVSVGLDMAEAKAQPTPFPSTVAAYPLAGEFVAQLLARLAAAAGDGPLLPPATVLNINVPARAAGEIKGVRFAPLSAHGGFRMVYRPLPGAARMQSTVEVDAAGATDGDTDTAWFARDYITVSVLRPDWNGGANERAAATARIGVLETLRPVP